MTQSEVKSAKCSHGWFADSDSGVVYFSALRLGSSAQTVYLSHYCNMWVINKPILFSPRALICLAMQQKPYLLTEWKVHDARPSLWFHCWGTRSKCPWPKSLWGTLNRLWSSLNLIPMLHILPTSQMRQLWKVGDCYPVFCPVCSVSRNAVKRFTAHRSEETICCLQVWLIDRSFFDYGWKQEDIFLWIISIFRVYGRTGFVPKSGEFLSLSSKTKTRTMQDFYDSH